MQSETELSNVVLITVDSLRADAISPYDADRHTPMMDSLADRGPERVLERFGSIVHDHASTLRSRDQQQPDAVDENIERRLAALGYR